MLIARTATIVLCSMLEPLLVYISSMLPFMFVSGPIHIPFALLANGTSSGPLMTDTFTQSLLSQTGQLLPVRNNVLVGIINAQLFLRAILAPSAMHILA